MPRTRHKSSLRKKLLIILLAAVLIPSIVVIGILIRTGVESQRAETVSLLTAASETASDEVRGFVRDVDSILTSTGLSHPFINRIRYEQVNTLTNLRTRLPFFRSLRAYLAPDLIYTSVPAEGDPEWEPATELITEGFARATGGDTYTSPVHFTPDGDALVLMMTPIGTPGLPPVGAVAGIVSLDQVQAIAERLREGNRQGVFVVDSAGRAIAVAGASTGVEVGENLRNLRPVRTVTGARSGGNLIYSDSRGREFLAAYRPVPDLGWGVVVHEPVAALAEPPYRAISAALLWLTGFVLLFALLGKYVSLKVTRPLARLREGAEIIGSGHLDYRLNIKTGDEMEDLADSFNRTAARLETSYGDLEQEHAHAVGAARQADTLLRVSQALVSTLRLDERLDLIAQSLAGVCDTDKVAIWLLRGNLLVPTTSHGLSEDEEKEFGRWQVHLEDAVGMTRQVITTQKPVIITNARTDPRVPERMAERFDIKSILALPLTLEEDVIGYAITYEAGKVRDFTENQVTMARAVAAQAAVAIQNAQAYERERRISDTLQRSFLPQVPPRIGAFEIADKYESALTEAEIGGDFYDLVQLSPTQFGFVIADISGKGLSAAVHTAMIKYMLRGYALEDIDKVELVRRLNRAVWRYIGGQMFITFFYGVLDTETKQLSYVNAGHELPLLYGEDRHICMRLETTGTALGIVPDYDFSEECIEFTPGDSLLLYTDGATDVRWDGEFLGEDGLEAIFCNAAAGTAHEIADAVDAGIREFAGGQLHDDVALMVIKYSREAERRSVESLA